MRRTVSRHAPALPLLAAILSGCSSGKQTLGMEISSDTYLPSPGGPSYYARWSHGLPTDPSSYPIFVWMQSPPNAARFRDVGINGFTGLWQGPTEDQLTGLGAADMPTLCDQSGVWQAHLNDSTIEGWLQPDQPDDAQLQADGSYAGCVEPAAVQESYASKVKSDGTRPIFMNLGRGVADANWVGRGSCSGRTDMYPEYAKGADILAFVTYPVNAGLPLETMAHGIDNLRRWSNDEKPVFAAIEASNIDDVIRPTPAQIKSEVWMALVHGAGGIQYYCHSLKPAVDETDCLDDAPTASALSQINQEVTRLAPVLNMPSVANGVAVTSSATAVPVDTMLKRDGSVTYLFAVGMRDASTTAVFTVLGIPSVATAEVIGETRTLDVTDGSFRDEFSGYGVHLYRISSK